MAEWWAYGDETGTQAGSEYCAVLGYIGSPRQWKLFRRDWRTVLGKKIPEFHAVKFFQRESWQSSDSPYHGWSDEKAKAFLDNLLRTINRYDIRPIGFAFNVPAFEALSLEERKRLTGAVRYNRVRTYGGKLEATSKLLFSGAPTQPYFLGWHYFVTEALKAAPPGVTVNFVFDHRLTAEARAHQTFEEIRRFTDLSMIRDKLGLLSFGDSKKYEPLQAADLYAYTWNRALHESVTELVQQAHLKLTKKRTGMGIAETDFYPRLLDHQDAEREDWLGKALGIENA